MVLKYLLVLLYATHAQGCWFCVSVIYLYIYNINTFFYCLLRATTCGDRAWFVGLAGFIVVVRLDN